MLHICPRLPHQPFIEPPFEEEILAFLWFLGHSGAIKRLTDVEHKDTKKSNEMYYPRFMKFGALLPIELTNEDIRNSNAYKEYYAVATGATPPKPKASVRKTRSSSDITITPPNAAVGPRLTTSKKGKQAGKASKAKSLYALSENSTDEEGNDDEGKDGDGDDEGNDGDDGKEGDDDDNDEQDDDDTQDDDDQEDEWNDEDDEEEGSDDGKASNKEELIHPSLSTHAEEETRDEESFDPIPKTPENSDDKGNGEENLGTNVGREEGHDEEEEEDELYRHVNINLGRVIQTTQEFEDSHVTLTPVNPDGQQQSSSVSSQFVTMAPLPMSAPTLTPSIIATITTTLQAPTPPTIALSTLLQDLPDFSLLFRFDNRLKTLEANFSEFMQTNQFAGAVSSIPRIVQRYIDQRMNEIIKEQVKEQVKVQVSKILPKIEQTMNEQLEAKVLTRSSNSLKTSYAIATDLFEMELKKILIEKMKGNKSIHRFNEKRNLYKALVEAYESNKIILDTYRDTITLKRCRDDDDDKDEEPSAGPDQNHFVLKCRSKRRREGKKLESASAPKTKATRSAGKSTQRTKSRQMLASADDQPIVEPSQHQEWFSQQKKPTNTDRDWNKTLQATQGSIQSWISDLAKRTDSRSSFNELMDTPVDFSNFLMNRLNVDTLTLELLAGPTYELMKGSCKSLVELKFFLEEVYKATTDQIDWVNPKGQQYPHNMLKPLPLIPDSQGRRVIPFNHIINNDLEYLRGGASNHKYTTSVTKTKAADYGHIKHVEDGVESYQKKLNLTKPDTYRSDLKRKEAYIAYSNPRRFIYQNKDKQNRLMRIDELHKFSDGTLTDVRTALDDRLTEIQMKPILKDFPVTPTKPRRMTKPYSSHCFIVNCFNTGNLKMEVKTLEDSKIWVLTPIRGIREEIGITTFRNAIRAHYLPHYSKYVTPPSLAVVRPWFASIRSELKRKQSSKHTSESKTEASKSKTGQSDNETMSSSAKDNNLSQPSASTPMVDEMHKEAQQVADGPTSLRATRCDASADSTAKADPRKFAPNDSIS
nr:hypothetical protein [Tanacetum cinerariifolium]